MRCLKCKNKVVTEIRRHNAAFCQLHFLEYFEKQVTRNIRRHRMCSLEDRILVAVSGGKDSLTLWNILTQLGFKTTGLHIHLGIGSYSPGGFNAALKFAQEQNRDSFKGF